MPGPPWPAHPQAREITLAIRQAEAIALRHVLGPFPEREYELEVGGWRDFLDFRQGKRIHEVGVDADTGKIVEGGPMKVLVAEDDGDTAGFIGRGLGALGHQVTLAATGGDALHLGVVEPFDVVVLDRLMPGLGGLEVLRRWRTDGIRVPVLLLTALGGIADRVAGLEAGADDYLVKPFAFAELAARLDALHRRPPINATPTCFAVGDITLDLLTREVRRGDALVRLQPREFSILEQLMRHAGRVVTRTMLLEAVWGYQFDPQTNIVESHLSRLRTKLNERGAPDAIETLRGLGYRMRTDG